MLPLYGSLLIPSFLTKSLIPRTIGSSRSFDREELIKKSGTIPLSPKSTHEAATPSRSIHINRYTTGKANRFHLLPVYEVKPTKTMVTNVKDSVIPPEKHPVSERTCQIKNGIHPALHRILREPERNVSRYNLNNAMPTMDNATLINSNFRISTFYLGIAAFIFSSRINCSSISGFRLLLIVSVVPLLNSTLSYENRTICR